MDNNSSFKQFVLNASLFGSIVYSAFYMQQAHAEINVGLLLGQSNYTTNVKGDAIYAYGGAGRYFQYPMDINSKDITAGPLLRYMQCLGDTFSIGIEMAYLYINQDLTAPRADDLFLGVPRTVETFKTESKGVGIINAVGRVSLTPDVNFQVFAGPAWLNTKYAANDIQNGVTIATGSQYQLTADIGAEAEWYFTPDWSVSMRYDYILNTPTQTVATRGALGDALLVNNTAESNVTIASLVLRYAIV